MIGGPYVLYSEVAGTSSTESEISSLLHPIDRRKALFLLCRMNSHFRLAQASEGISFERAVGDVQVFLFKNFTDEVLFEQIKKALGNTMAHHRPLFHPLQLLTMMRLSMKHCEHIDESDNVTDEQRYTVGRCCLMTNDLLAAEEHYELLSRRSQDYQRAAVMTRFLPEFEINNPGELQSLLNRALVTFNVLLSDSYTRARILKRTGGYDLVARFQDLTGVALERWIAVLFCIIAYYSTYGGENGTDQEYTYLWIDPKSFSGTSDITDDDLSNVLALVGIDIEDLSPKFETASSFKASVNITPLKFFPLIRIGNLYICSDIGFLVEKLYAGVYWALHDREDDAGKMRLGTAWGNLFECYVNWWAQGRTFKKPISFFPFPSWRETNRNGRRRKKAETEAFDAVILQDGRLAVLEYKGGFLKLEAKYSINLRALLRDVNKKIAKGCKQLATNIGELFGIGSERTLEGIPTSHITRVIPIIVVQDQALRSPGMNWWLNRQFQRELRKIVLRPIVTVEPLTLVHISEFETMIDSAEGHEFGLLETIQLRNFRDREGLSDLHELLLSTKGFGTQNSTRRQELESEFNRCVTKYAFPKEYKNER